MLKTNEIQIRDPFVYPDPHKGIYFLFGTTDKNCWEGPGQGFDCYKSQDLQHWEGPIPVFRPDLHFWGKVNFWAPEVYGYQGRYYMFATFKAKNRYRATHILVSDHVTGPYHPLTKTPITPPEWECLDGTLFIDEEGVPWIVFCHEWVQVHNGAIYAMQLTSDLRNQNGRPVFLFSASEAPWVKPSQWPQKEAPFLFPTYVTDGPFLFRSCAGVLFMLWSSHGKNGYTMGLCRSESGKITGPWKHEVSPLWKDDGGHGMIFRSFDRRLFLTFHQPNDTPNERPIFLEIEDFGTEICIKKTNDLGTHAGQHHVSRRRTKVQK